MYMMKTKINSFIIRFEKFNEKLIWMWTLYIKKG